MKALLLPGMDGTGRLFEKFAHFLPATLEPVVVSYPVDRALSYEELADFVVLPSEPFVIVAESFSGPLALRIAERNPTGLRGLVLVATFVRSPTNFARWATGLGALAFRVPPPGVALRWALLGHDAPVEELESLRSAMRAVTPEVMAARVRDIASVDARAALRTCPMPILYLAGSRDRIVGARSLETMLEARPDIEVRQLDAPHLVLQRAPEEAARLVVSWIERVTR